MANDCISHVATVVELLPDGLRVRIADLDDCGACKVADLCGKGSEGRSDTLDVAADVPQGLEPGQRVRISIPASATATAYLWTLVVPLCLLIGEVIPLALAGWGGWAVALGLALMGLWYAGLYARRRHFAKKMRWRVEKL